MRYDIDLPGKKNHKIKVIIKKRKHAYLVDNFFYLNIKYLQKSHAQIPSVSTLKIIVNLYCAWPMLETKHIVLCLKYYIKDYYYYLFKVVNYMYFGY